MKHSCPLLFALTGAIMLVSGIATAAQSTTPRAVVELYTSQGCNSCPPADRVLYELNQEDSDLLVLSYHVDYWNYLGWVDPFSDVRYSDRQRDYASRMRERYVYTPQVIINGDAVVRATAKQNIESTSKSVTPLKNISEITITSGNATSPASGTVTLQDVGTANATSQVASRLWLIGFDREHQRDVLSGENAGKRLVHANVVREMTDLGPWDGKARDIPFTMNSACDGGIILMVQDGRGGPITAASVVRF